jgi:hypothetical protein
MTGYDNVLFTCRDPRPVVIEVLKSLSDRWPQLRIEIDSLHGVAEKKHFDGGVLPTLSDLFETTCEVLVIRDSEMQEHWTEQFHMPMPDGEGAVLLIYRPRGPIVLQLRQVIEVVRENSSVIDPYEAWLAAPNLVELTAVTPGYPPEHPFSGWIWNQVLQACLQKSENEKCGLTQP